MEKEEFIEYVLALSEERDNYIRLGQFVFNHIDDNYGDIARMIQYEKHVDCFYDDSKIMDFLSIAFEYIKERNLPIYNLISFNWARNYFRNIDSDGFEGDFGEYYIRFERKKSDINKRPWTCIIKLSTEEEPIAIVDIKTVTQFINLLHIVDKNLIDLFRKKKSIMSVTNALLEKKGLKPL